MNRTTPTLKTTFGVLIAIAFFMVIAAPPATAQTIPIGCDAISTPVLTLTGGSAGEINPGEEGNPVVIEYEYTAPRQAFSLSPVQIDFDVNGAPAWAEVILSKKTDFVTVEPVEETNHHGKKNLTISLHEDAPVGEWAIVTVEANAHEGTCVTAAQVSEDVRFAVAENDSKDVDFRPMNDNATTTRDAEELPAPSLLLLGGATLALLVPGLKRRR